MEKVRIPEERFYFDDPNAPQPNVPLHPGVSAVLFDSERRILFMKRKHGPYWSLPGGRIDMDESAQDCCVRETLEETGLSTRIRRVISINTSPRSVVHYPDGNIHRSFVICFEAEIVGGELQENAEASGFQWCSREEIEAERIRLIPDSYHNAMDAWSSEPTVFIR